MSDKKISELITTPNIHADDISVLVSDGTDYRFAFSTLLQFLGSNLTVGCIITFGTILPQNTIGKNGEVFINTVNASFAQKLSGTWSIVYTLPSIASVTDGTVLYGLGEPGDLTGTNNDTYIDTGTSIFYKKATDVWSQAFSIQTGPQGPQGINGTNGTAGTNGNTIITGISDPSNLTDGVNGDYYINISNYTLFGPKTSGTWSDGISLINGGTPDGGNEGDVLIKNSNDDYDTGWVNLNEKFNLSDYAKISNALTEGSIPFIDSNGALTQDNSRLFWDNIHKALGIGTNTPSSELPGFNPSLAIVGDGYGTVGRTTFIVKNINSGSAASLAMLNSDNHGVAMQASSIGYGGGAAAGFYTFGGIPLYFNSDGDTANGGTSPIEFIQGGYLNQPQLMIDSGQNVVLNPYEGAAVIGKTTTDAGYILTANGNIITYGLDVYATDLSGNYTNRTKIDKGYADANYASLVSGKVSASQLPSYVDDVLDFGTLSDFPVSGEIGKIYIAVDTNYQYRWNEGTSTYIQIIASPGSTDAIAEGASNFYYTNARVATYCDLNYYPLSTNPAGYITSITRENIEAALSFLPANDSTVVHTTGDENIAGKKTFSDEFTVTNTLITAKNLGGYSFSTIAASNTFGKTLVGNNQSNSLGETNLINIQGSSGLATGGFKFQMIDTTGSIIDMMQLKGDTNEAVFGTSIIIRSPNGSLWRLNASNAGVLTLGPI